MYRRGMGVGGGFSGPVRNPDQNAGILNERQRDDRRVIKTRVTPQGLEILKKLETPVREMHKGQFAHMSVARLKQLVELLEEIRKRESEETSEAS